MARESVLSPGDAARQVVWERGAGHPVWSAEPPRLGEISEQGLAADSGIRVKQQTEQRVTEPSSRRKRRSSDWNALTCCQ